MEPLAFKLRPSSTVPVLFWLTGLVGWLALLVAVALQPQTAITFPLRAHGIFLLHLAALGWLTPVMLGAYYQLVPVVLHAPIRGQRWGYLIYGGFVVGALTFLGGWALGSPACIAWGGAILGAAIYGFLAHMALSLSALRRLGVTALAFMLALASLAAVGTLGPLLALGIGGVLNEPVGAGLLPAHAAAALGGWLLLTVIGASYQLVPFFAATPPAVRPRLGHVAVGAVAVGVAWVAVGPVPAAGGALALAGVVAWTGELGRLVGHGRQARREPVVAASYLAAAALLVAACGAEAMLAGWWGGPSAPVALGLLGLVAGPGLLVLGQLQKILPFLAALDVSLAAKRQGGVPKTEALFPREAGFALLMPLAAALGGLVGTDYAGSPLGVRIAAAGSAVVTCIYLLFQARAVRAWLLAQRMR